MPGSKQHAVLLPAGRTRTLPSDARAIQLDSTNADILLDIYAPCFPAGAQLIHLPLAINAHLDAAHSIILVHAPPSTASPPSLQEENALANLLPVEKTGASSSTTIIITGNAVLSYAEKGRHFHLTPDWEALYDACYGAQLGPGTDGRKEVDVQALASEFMARLESSTGDSSMQHHGEEGEQDGLAGQENHADDDNGDDDDGAWTDEEVEKPREKRPDIDSDDEEGGEQGGESEEDKDSNASYDEDESELDSDDDDGDDENDPRKQALLNTIKDIIMKDGKIDLERLGLVEKNGKLVPKEP